MNVLGSDAYLRSLLATVDGEGKCPRGVAMELLRINTWKMMTSNDG